MAIELNTDIELAKDAKQARARTKRATKSVRSKAAASVTHIVLSNSGDAAPTYDADTRRKMIEEAAYYLAERRGFEAGHELEDWFSAEREY